MDKYEYKIRADEINKYIEEKKYKEAVEIADTIDWRNVKNTMMLCSISDLYKMCKRFEDSRDVLLLAYERNPNGRLILYSLCELSIKLGDVLSAFEFYKAFCYYAPKDTGRYILRYKLLTAQEVGLDERIQVLEELQTYECKEKWMYELAYLYHMQGVSDKCVEECNQIVLYFGEGKYVVKALALKQLHEPLSGEQDILYRRLTEPQASEITIKEMDVSQYNTIDLQKELANSLAEVLPKEESEPEKPIEEVAKEEPVKEAELENIDASENIEASEGDITKISPEDKTSVIPVEDIKEIAEESDLKEENVIESLDIETEESLSETKVIMTLDADVPPAEKAVSDETKIFNINEVQSELRKEKIYSKPALSDGQIRLSDMMEIFPESKGSASVVFPSYDDMVSIEGDGQISMNIPEQQMVDKQITGQISIDEVLAEWERMKTANEKKWAEDMRKKVLEQTTGLLKDFDASSKDGLLERLESEVENSDTVTLTKEEEEHLLHDSEEEGLAIDILSVSDAEEEQPEESTAKESVEEPEEEPENNEIREIVLEEESEPTKEELSFDRSEFANLEPELTEELTSKEPASLDNTVALPQLNELDYLLAFAEAAEENDKANMAVVGSEVPVEEVLSEDISEITIEEKEEVDTTEEVIEEITTAESDNEPVSEESEAEAEVEAVTEDDTEADVESDEDSNEEPSDNESEEDYSEPEIRESGFTEEQEERFEAFIQTEEAREQLKEALANISMENGHGNVIIGSEDIDSSIELAKAIMMELSVTEGITGKVAKTKASTLNAKDAEETLAKLYDGALIIQDANELRRETIEAIRRTVLAPDKRIFIALTATKRAKHHFVMENRDLLDSFNVSIDIDALSDDELVAYAKGYAYSKEYAIDDMGILELHTRIDARQTNEHSVTIKEVKEIVDEAIAKANKITFKHFFGNLVGKRYDDNSMIVLTEKDFTE